MGEREDLRHGMERVPDLEDRWQKRRLELEQKLDEAWARLKAMQLEENSSIHKEPSDMYEQIARLDRSISFLDRALMHLDDIQRGGEHAKDVDLRPASSPKEHEHLSQRPR